VGVCVGFVKCDCFGNMCTCVYPVFVLFRLYIFIFLCFCLICVLCILIVMYVLFCTFCFHRTNWHSSATLTEVFPCFYLSCEAIARV